jgi:hypothetical protein
MFREIQPLLLWNMAYGQPATAQHSEDDQRPDGRPNSMDLKALLRKLYTERETIERAIASLEPLLVSDRGEATALAEFTGNRRGRKSMGQKERREVSKRMKQYWAKRRGCQGNKTEIE